ncbi:MAG: class I SAM-dependent methyltransferase [Nitrospirota bacterium]
MNTTCPLCNGNDTIKVYERNAMPFGFFLSSGLHSIKVDLKISFCRDCLFVFQDSAYNSPDYDKKFNKIYKRYQIMDKNITPFPYESGFGETIDFLSQNMDFSNINNVLEIGSNRGDLLYLLRQRHKHLNVIGIEPSDLDYASVVTVKSPFNAALFSNKFGLIIMRHVLEHVKYPLQFLFDIKKILSSRGLLFIEVPNLIRDLSDNIECFTPDHVNYFSSDAIKEAGRRADMNINVLKNGLEGHLMVILENSAFVESGGKVLSSRDLLVDKLRMYRRNLENIVEVLIKLVIRDDFKIIFYGTGNAFMWVFSKLKADFGLINHNILNHTLFCIDDSSAKYGKEIYNNIKIYNSEYIGDVIHPKVLIILCSFNREFAGKMELKVKKMNNISISDLRIMRPWEKIIKIK